MFLLPVIDRTAPSQWDPLRYPKKIDETGQLHLDYGKTNPWEKLPKPCQGSAHTVDTFGLIALLCLVKVRSVLQVAPLQKENSQTRVWQPKADAALSDSKRLNVVLYNS